MGEPAPPFVSVAIRSYRRLPQLLELVTCLQDQQYPRFEVVVIEQTESERARYRAELTELRRDSRVRILEYPPLGAGAARNEAARQSRGEIVLFIDDDDLPVGADWITSHAVNYADPYCMAVSGRHILDGDDDDTRHDTARNRRLCLRYSWLKMPRGRTYHGTRISGVTQVAGTNASIRKSAIERAGGWDPEPDHDEDSFNFRFERVKQPKEYFVYDPAPCILRRLGVEGGLGRRQEGAAARLRAELRFSHCVVRRYFPVRFWTLYPVYLLVGARRALRHVAEARATLERQARQ